MAEASVLLRVFFYGLIAFVPDNVKKPTELSVLLVDARTPPYASDGCFMPPHLPRLIYRRTSAIGCNADLDCEAEGEFCVCPLDRKEVSFEMTEDSACLDANRAYVCNARDFSLVPEMRRIKRRARDVNEACRANGIASERSVPRALVAKIQSLGVDHDILVCKKVGEDTLAKTTEGRSIDKTEFTFRSLISRTYFGHKEDDLAEILLVPTLVRRHDAGGRVNIKVSIRSLDSAYYLRELMVEAKRCGGISDYCADIIIVNEMVMAGHETHVGRCSDLKVGRHFELYYHLSKRKIWQAAMPVPHEEMREVDEKEPSSCESQLLADFVAERFRAGEDRPICPMVSFSE